MSAAEYNTLVSAAGGNPRKAKLPPGSHNWPTAGVGVALDDPDLLRPVVNTGCWCTPVARAVRGEMEDVVLLLSVQDTELSPGATKVDDRWQVLSTWTPRQARVLAAQLLAAARAAENKS